MNISSFLALTKSSGRKLLNNSHKEKDIKIIEAGMKSLEKFLLGYYKKFEKHLSSEQKNSLLNIIKNCQESTTKETYQKLTNEIKIFNSSGVNILVRHPEPLMASYRKLPGKNLTMRGMIQVWRFNKFLKQFLEAYDNVTVNFYNSDSKRTRLFADLSYSYLSRNSNARLTRPRQNSSLSGSGSKIKDMKERYPELKETLEDGSPLNRRKLRILREHFRKWITESPLSEATSNEIRNLMSALSEKTINIYFSHENTIGSYLFHELNVDIKAVLIRYAGYIIASNGHVHVDY